jgi:site-specific DNA-cytosine methylase
VNVLVACEESQRVTTEFRRLGHNAFSCDIIDQSGGHPEWHIMQDVLPLLNGDCAFETTDGAEHEIVGAWDMIIAFPPCTHLCSSGQRWFAEGKKPRSLQNEAIEFFMQFVNADCDKIAIENPVGIMSTRYRKPNQIINPYQFGSTECKKTCLWLKGLPLLVPTDVCPPEKRTTNIWKAKFNGKQYSWNSQETKKLRSKTFPGIAKAMAEQFGGDIRDAEVDGITTWR